VKRSEYIFIGSILILLGFIFVCRQRKQFDDNSQYRVTIKQNGNVWSESDAGGGELNIRESNSITASRIVGSFFIAGGTAILLYQLKRAEKTR
jgi:hypothetical protein